MTDSILEQVSAFADDELGDAEAPLLVARLARDAKLRDTLGRYELIGEALRGSLPGQRKDFAAGVMAAIENEDVEAESRPESQVRRFPRGLAAVARPAAGVAVAASVAMLAIITLRGPSVPVGTEAPAEVVPAASGVVGTSVVPAQQVDFSNVRSPELQNQLRSYLMNHNEHAGSSRIRGVMPYVQIAAQDSRPVGEGDDAATTRTSNGGVLPNDPQF